MSSTFIFTLSLMTLWAVPVAVLIVAYLRARRERLLEEGMGAELAESLHVDASGALMCDEMRFRADAPAEQPAWEPDYQGRSEMMAQIFDLSGAARNAGREAQAVVAELTYPIYDRSGRMYTNKLKVFLN